jgi:hypothetical protein
MGIRSMLLVSISNYHLTASPCCRRRLDADMPGHVGLIARPQGDVCDAHRCCRPIGGATRRLSDPDCGCPFMRRAAAGQTSAPKSVFPTRVGVHNRSMKRQLLCARRSDITPRQLRFDPDEAEQNTGICHRNDDCNRVVCSRFVTQAGVS